MTLTLTARSARSRRRRSTIWLEVKVRYFPARHPRGLGRRADGEEALDMKGNDAQLS